MKRDMTSETNSAGERMRPLVVDLDGTLVRSDLLVETALGTLAERPQEAAGLVRALLRGKAALKSFCAERAVVDPELLPYEPTVLAYIEQARTAGRPVYLASAADCAVVRRVADHLGLFDGWFASDGQVNLSGAAKADALARAFGVGGFDYLADGRVDLPVWHKAGNAIVVREEVGVLARLRRAGIPTSRIEPARTPWNAWLRLLRPHQYAKNMLVFVPLLTAQAFTWDALSTTMLTFVAFSLCASAVYILNDALDLTDDRRHRSKRARPLASGAIPVKGALLLAPGLLLAAFVVASAISGAFAAVLLGYAALTTAYSLYLKRKLLVDVITLAMLYAVRVLGGATAIAVPLSEWLVAFCLMMFISLALMKRYVELASRKAAGQSDSTRRNYRDTDLQIVAALAAASAFNAVTIFALYVSSDTVQQMYTRGRMLWLFVPLLIYWVSRALVLTTRREMNDDPIVFALKDRVSLLTGLCGVLIVLLAV